MLVGLLRFHKNATQFGLGQLLWRQVGGPHFAFIGHSYLLKGSDLALFGHRRGGPSGGQSDHPLILQPLLEPLTDFYFCSRSFLA